MTCSNKRRYSDQPAALAFAEHCAKRNGQPLHSYKCEGCGGWHLTKQVQNNPADDFEVLE